MAKYKIIPSTRTIVQSPISIGHKAEKGVEAIEFDLTAWVETYGSGTLTVIMRRWGDAIPYPIALEIDENNKATWTLSDTDTAKAGMAYAQLSYIVGDEVVKKSDIYTFRVMDSLTGEGDPPEAYESWLEHLTHFAAEAMAEVLDIEGVATDKTLTVDGGIADAKAAGDALALKADKSTTYTKTEVDTLIESVDVETDTTLSVTGKPADAKATGDALSALEDQFSEETDQLKADLNDSVNGLRNDLYGGEYKPQSWRDGMIYNHLESTNSTFQRTGEITLNKGETITFTGGKGTTSVPVNALTGVVNGAYQALKYYSGSEAEAITYTAPLDMIIIVSTLKTLYGNDLVVEKNGSINDFDEDIEALQKTIPYHVTDSASGSTQFSIKSGNEYRFVNNLESETILHLRKRAGDTTAQILLTLGGYSENIYSASDNYEYIIYTKAVDFFIVENPILDEFVESKINCNEVLKSLQPNTYIATQSGNIKYTFEKGQKYVIANNSDYNIRFATRNNPGAASIDVLDIPLHTRYTFEASGNANYLVFNHACEFEVGKESDLLFTIENNDFAVGNQGKPYPLVRFDFVNDMKNYSQELQNVDFLASNGQWCTIFNTIQDKFDSLLTSDFCTRIDAGADVGLAYPSYAQLGGQASGSYSATPSYLTYMYKIASPNDYVYGANNQKKKILLVGATHGSEVAGAFNLYLFAKNLINSVDSDYFKLLSSFDWYIIPCLNGYGVYHLTRWNADGIDINRNFPTRNFQVSGQPYEVGYTGETAGNTFEAQIIMALSEKYNFDIVIDHHNYGGGSGSGSGATSGGQFYTESSYGWVRPLANASLNDCSYAFIQSYPEYFGTKHKLFVDSANSTLPNAIFSDTHSTMERWSFEQGIDFSATLEISNQINYTNGVIDTENKDKYTPTVFAVGEFTLRNQLLYYCGFVLGASL